MFYSLVQVALMMGIQYFTERLNSRFSVLRTLKITHIFCIVEFRVWCRAGVIPGPFLHLNCFTPFKKQPKQTRMGDNTNLAIFILLDARNY